MVTATIKFETGKGISGYYFVKSREFNDRKHLDNYIKYVTKKEGWLLDEVWIEEDTTKIENK